jgi:K(+)-stimulated pyrophosphate-energized sodium pump
MRSVGIREQAVGRAAILIVEAIGPAVSRGPRHSQGASQPDGERCVAIYTSAEQREMVLSAVLSVMAPVAVGLVPNVAGVTVPYSLL